MNIYIFQVINEVNPLAVLTPFQSRASLILFCYVKFSHLCHRQFQFRRNFNRSQAVSPCVPQQNALTMVTSKTTVYKVTKIILRWANYAHFCIKIPSCMMGVFILFHRCMMGVALFSYSQLHDGKRRIRK